MAENEIQISCEAATTVALDDLVEFQGKLKTITNKNLEKLKRSILRHGFTAPMFVWVAPDSRPRIIDGHQRLRALQALRREGYSIPELPTVYIHADTEDEAKEKLLYITSQYGEFTTDGYKAFAEGLRVDLSDIRLASSEFTLAKEDDAYSRNVEPPIYDPTGERPSIDQLYDNTKAYELIDEIDASNIPEEIKSFLRLAAMRHVVFDYRNIAEFYAHADEQVQHLFERSALVIIDFDKAIEGGFVDMTKRIRELYIEDYDA